MFPANAARRAQQFFSTARKSAVDAVRPLAGQPVRNLREARAMATMASILYAAYEVASPEQRQQLEQFGVLGPEAVLDQRFPERPAMRACVAKWPLEMKQRALAFARDNLNFHNGLATLAVEGFSGAPEFERTQGPTSFQGENEELDQNRGMVLGPFLRWAYSEGQVGSLVETIWPSWQKKDFSRSTADKFSADVRQYMRLSPELWLPKQDAFMNPFLAPYTGANVFLSMDAAGSPTSILQMTGPYYEEIWGAQLLMHEFSHPAVNAVLFKNDPAVTEAFEKASRVYETISDPQSYVGWASYLPETLCRAIAKRATGLPPSDDWDLEVFFMRELAENFETNPALSFSDFMIGALGRLEEQRFAP
jgi:hypothetical protein